MKINKKGAALALALLLAATALCGNAAQSGAALGNTPPGRENLPEYYAGLLSQGIITQQEYDKLEAYDFVLPESEKEPIDDFLVGEVRTGTAAFEGAQ